MNMVMTLSFHWHSYFVWNFDPHFWFVAHLRRLRRQHSLADPRTIRMALLQILRRHHLRCTPRFVFSPCSQWKVKFIEFLSICKFARREKSFGKHSKWKFKSSVKITVFRTRFFKFLWVFFKKIIIYLTVYNPLLSFSKGSEKWETNFEIHVGWSESTVRIDWYESKRASETLEAT